MKSFASRGLLGRVTTWIRSRSSERSRRQIPSRARPHLEALEERSLLTAGMLDPTFGVEGKITLRFEDLTDQYRAYSPNVFIPAIFCEIPLNVVVLPDGFINVTGSVESLVYDNGAPALVETLLSPAGDVVYKAPGFGWMDPMAHTAVQADGKTLLVGVIGFTSRFTVQRFNTDGSLDTYSATWARRMSSFLDSMPKPREWPFSLTARSL